MKKSDGIIVAEDDDRIEVQDSSEVPDFKSDEEELEFWRTHTFGEEFWRRAKPIADAHLPPKRQPTKRRPSSPHPSPDPTRRAARS